MTFIRDTQRIREQFKSDLEPRVETKFGLVKAVDGDIYAGDDYHVWVQEIGGDIMPYRVYVPDERPLAEGMGVYFRRDPVDSEIWKIIDLNTSPYAQQPDVLATFPSAGIQQHGRSHIINRPAKHVGSDPLDVTDDMLVSFRVSPTNPPSMKVSINPGTYAGATNYGFHRSPFLSEDMTARIPANPGEAKLVAVGLDNTGALQYTEGTVYSNDAPFVPTTALPAVPIAQELLAIVRLWRDGSGTAMGRTPATITNAEFDQTRRGKAGGGGGRWQLEGGTGPNIYYDAGLVGIGHDTPTESLDIVRDGANATVQLTAYAAGNATSFVGQRATGDKATPGPIGAGGTILSLIGRGYGTDGFYRGAHYSQVAGSGVTGNDIPGEHVWYTHALGDAVDSVTERMRLASHGALGIGTTSPEGLQVAATVSETLRGSTNVRLGVASGSTPRIIFEHSATQWETDNSGGQFRIFQPGVVAVSINNSTHEVGMGTTSPDCKLHVWRDTAGAVSANPQTVLAVEGAGAAYLEVLAGGEAGFLLKATDVAMYANTPGTLSIHSGAAQTLFLDSSQNLGFKSVSSPQGMLHGYDSIGGILYWEYDGLDSTSRTVIPNGAGDVQYHLYGMYVIRDSGTNTQSGFLAVTPSNNQVLMLASGNQFAIFVAADGAVTVRRVVGTTTAKVALWLLWI